jgi:hypothetical protein
MEYTKIEKAIIIAMIATAFLTLWAILYVPIFDGDIWFHLLYGKAILENHTLTPDHTIYSWTPSSNNHIYCAWFGQVIYFLLHKYSGFYGIIALRYLTATTLFITILHLARQRNTLYNPITWFSATLCILIMSLSVLDKPEVISIALMALIVWNWYEIKQLNNKILYHLYLFPLLILVWVNTHGVFTFGCLFLLCVGVGETLNQLFYQQNALPRKIYYHLLLALCLSAGAIFITPYGYDYIQQLILQSFDKQLQNDISHVMAYSSTFEINNTPQLPLFANTSVVIIGLVFIASLRKKQLDFVPIVSNLLFAFLFTTYVRLIFLWVPVFALSIAYYGSAIRFTKASWRHAFIVTFALATFLLSGWILYHEKNYPSRERWLDFGISEMFTIEEELNFINKNFPNAKLGNMYGHGAYILWKTWPATKVMTDARYFPYKDWFNEYTTFVKGKNVEVFIQKYPFDVIEIRHDSPLVQWFYKSKDWQLAFYGKSAVVFVRSSLALPGKTIRGQGLNNILGYETAVNVFNTTLQIKDWAGTDIVLATMKKSFTNKHQQTSISGLEQLKSAAQMYEQKDYSASLHFMEKALEKNVGNPAVHAAILLMTSIEDWQNKQWHTALKEGIQSLATQYSFAATYNVALMALQIKTMEQSGQITPLDMTEQEKETTKRCQDTLTNLAQEKEKLPPKYAPYIENVEKIIKGSKNYKMQLIEPDWL